eukprot:4880727-Prymnesium_polylepis.1
MDYSQPLVGGRSVSQPLVGGHSVHSTPARQICNLQLVGGSKRAGPETSSSARGSAGRGALPLPTARCALPAAAGCCAR